MANMFARPVTIEKELLMNVVHGVSFAGHPYWLIDLLGTHITACPSLEMAQFMKDKINGSVGDIDLNALRCEFIRKAVTGQFMDTEFEAVEPEELAKEDDFYAEQEDKAKFYSKKKKQKRSKK